MSQDEIPEVWWKPADERGPACLAIRLDGPKRYLRLWFPEEIGAPPKLEWGWTMADTAVVAAAWMRTTPQEWERLREQAEAARREDS